jgi:hypothetical protein
MESILMSLAIPASLLVFGAGLSWFISIQFAKIQALINERIEKTQNIILAKLEYHERHDDQRFERMNQDLWEIRVRNAAKDKEMLDLHELRRNLTNKDESKI